MEQSQVIACILVSLFVTVSFFIGYLIGFKDGEDES